LLLLYPSFIIQCWSLPFHCSPAMAIKPITSLSLLYYSVLMFYYYYFLLFCFKISLIYTNFGRFLRHWNRTSVYGAVYIKIALVLALPYYGNYMLLLFYIVMKMRLLKRWCNLSTSLNIALLLLLLLCRR